MTSGARNMPGKGHARQEKMPRSPRKQLNPGDDKEFCVVTWGRGDQNQLGNGEQFDRAAPVTMLFTKTQISSMACGHMHTLIMVGPAHSPRVFAWGEGQHGQLGLPKSASMQAMHPVEVQALAPTPAFKVLEVGAGGDGSFALTSRQEMLVWGNNSREQLGLGSSFRRADKIFTPQPLSSTWDTTEMQWRTLYIKKAVLGRRFGLAIDKYDRLFAWGENNYGQLGVGDKNSRNSPVMVEALQNVRQIAVGLQHSAAIDSRRLLWTWGDCSDGRLGHGVLYTEVRSVKGDEITRNRKQVDFLLEPKCVDSFRLGSKAREVQLVACGDRFTAALDCHGTAWTWGSGIYGQLGRGSGKLSSQLPERVSLTEAQSMSPDSSMMQQEVSRRMSLGSFDGDEHGLKDDSVLQETSPGGHVSRMESNEGSQQNKMSINGGKLSFKNIQTGPYHCIALTDDGRVYTWGKGKHGVLGQGTDSNCYEPVQVRIDDDAPVRLVGTGEFHSLAVLDSERFKMIQRGFTMRTIPNSDDLVYILERDLSADDLAARFKENEYAPVKRHNPENKTAKGHFSNVVGVTEEGKIVFDRGSKTEVVELDEVLPARAVSLKGITRNIILDREGIIPNAEKFLECEGWDLLDTHIPAWPNEMCANLDPLLIEATSDEIKSQWSQYTPRVRESGIKKFKVTEREEGSQTGSPPESPKRATGFGQDSGITPLKKAMAVEDNRMFDDYHKKVVAKELCCVLEAHSRKPYGSITNLLSSLRMPVNNGKGTEPCGSVFSQAERFPVLRKEHEQPGPGEYGVNDTHPEWTHLEPVKTVKPAGIGLTLTLRENNAGYQQISFLTNDKGQWDLVVKDILKGGAVDSSNSAGRSHLAVHDIILKINGEHVSDIYGARQLMMGAPGSQVTILYKHKTSGGSNVTMSHTFVRRYIGTRKDCTGPDAEVEVYPPPGRYMGLGLQSERSDDAHSDVLTAEQEDQVLKVIHRLHDEMTQDNDNLLKGRLHMIPSGPGIKRVTEQMLKLFPRWSEDLSRPNAIVRIFKKHGYLEPTYANQRDNPNVAPGAYDHRCTAAHNWTEDGKIAQSTVTYAHAGGPTKWVPPSDGKGDSSMCELKNAQRKDDRQLAEAMALGRSLQPGEYERLQGWKQRRVQTMKALLERREDGAPGPLQYAPVHTDIIGQPRAGHRESDSGHHKKGFTMAPKTPMVTTAGTSETPGPDRYNIRKEGLAASGDFASKKGGTAVYRARICPEQVEKDSEGEFYEKPASFSCQGHPFRKTAYSSAPTPKIGSREVWEKLSCRENGQVYDKETKTWRAAVPGPGSYTPRPPTSDRTPRLKSRDALEKDEYRRMGLVYDSTTKTYVSGMPGPADYAPTVSKDGKSIDQGKSALGPTIGLRLDPKKAAFETPGPSWYFIPSCFDSTLHSTPGGWIGEKVPTTTTKSNDVPGPGTYDTLSYDGIGTDHVSIGAAIREACGTSATAAQRDRDRNADTFIKPVVNYSMMNKAVEELKGILAELFENIYDTFAFFDLNGDWGVSESEFKKMLTKIDVELEPTHLSLIVRRMDTVADGMIDPKEFIQALRWHPPMYKRWKDEEQAMVLSARNRPMIVKNVMLRVAEKRVHTLAAKRRNSKIEGLVHGVAQKHADTSKDERPNTARQRRTMNLTKPQRPITARADMVRGFTMTPRRLAAQNKPSETPGPAGYLPHASGDIAIKVGAGKNAGQGVQVHDALCWAGSSFTTKAAPMLGKGVVQGPRKD